MGQSIVITSGKGGTGKTSVTGGVASCLAALGRTVLCLDADVGLRNLDISLGLSDRALMDFSDVLEGRCSLTAAAVRHPQLPNLSLLTAPVRASPESVDHSAMRALIREITEQYDYCLIDSPAGLGPGFRLAACGAERAILVSTTDASALRDAQRAVSELSSLLPQIHLVVNRVKPRLLRQLQTTIDDAMDTAGLPLLGVVPEDITVTISANRGVPVILAERKGAAQAYLNIARRLEGQRVKMMRLH